MMVRKSNDGEKLILEVFFIFPFIYVAALFALKEFPLSAIANLFEFRFQQKQLMPLSNRICPC